MYATQGHACQDMNSRFVLLHVSKEAVLSSQIEGMQSSSKTCWRLKHPVQRVHRNKSTRTSNLSIEVSPCLCKGKDPQARGGTSGQGFYVDGASPAMRKLSSFSWSVMKKLAFRKAFRAGSMVASTMASASPSSSCVRNAAAATRLVGTVTLR